jgi:hypothetical protein
MIEMVESTSFFDAFRKPGKHAFAELAAITR